SSNEGVNISDPDVSLRFDIIPLLIKDLMDKKVILVRAPPFSGKTSITQIMEHNLLEYIWRAMEKYCWCKLEEWIEQCDLIPTILILDEAQLIYAKEKKVDENNIEFADQFWLVVKGLATPVALPESNCKSLIDINFKRDELKKYIEKFCDNYFKNLDPPSVSKLYKYIWIVTKGHVGLVRHILMSTEKAMKNQIDTNHLFWEEIFKYFNSENFNSTIYVNCRAVPKVSALSDTQRIICEKIYLNGKIRYIDSNEDH
ncbi:6906_t:CDS:2, partial [Acaulospora morrowiae]